jgi:RNA polymerase subunit RPABC4/transcription elongation factor Spt4
MDQRQKDELDRYITGNYGEDQFNADVDQFQLTDADVRDAIKALIERGTWTDFTDLVQYNFGYDHGKASGDMHSPDGSHGYHFRGNLESRAPYAVLSWLLRRIDQTAVLACDYIIHDCKSACPFCGETATRSWVGETWNGCEHFAASLKEGLGTEHAYYVANGDEWRRCDHCESYNPEGMTRCESCDRNPIIDEGPDYDADMED